MPRPATQNLTISKKGENSNGSIKVKHPSNDVITIYADNAIYDETQGKFITPEDLIRN